jgi:hypothetical protein
MTRRLSCKFNTAFGQLTSISVGTPVASKLSKRAFRYTILIVGDGAVRCSEDMTQKSAALPIKACLSGSLAMLSGH